MHKSSRLYENSESNEGRGPVGGDTRKPANPKVSAPPAKPGRPMFAPTPVHRETVKIMTAAGIQQSVIAGLLRITPPTLRKHFKSEIAIGAAEVNLIVLRAHLKRIQAGDTRAIEWWLRCRMGWSERPVVDKERPIATPPHVVFEWINAPTPARFAPPAPGSPARA